MEIKRMFFIISSDFVAGLSQEEELDWARVGFLRMLLQRMEGLPMEDRDDSEYWELVLEVAFGLAGAAMVILVCFLWMCRKIVGKVGKKRNTGSQVKFSFIQQINKWIINQKVYQTICN